MGTKIMNKICVNKLAFPKKATKTSKTSRILMTSRTLKTPVRWQKTLKNPRKSPATKIPREQNLVNLFHISEDFWVSLSFLSDRSFLRTFVGGYKNTAIAEKREENPEILTNLVRKRLTRKHQGKDGEGKCSKSSDLISIATCDSNRKSLAIPDRVIHLRKSQCTHLLYRNVALRF